MFQFECINHEKAQAYIKSIYSHDNFSIRIIMCPDMNVVFCVYARSDFDAFEKWLFAHSIIHRGKIKQTKPSIAKHQHVDN